MIRNPGDSGGYHHTVLSPVGDILILGRDEYLIGLCFPGREKDILRGGKWQRGSTAPMETAERYLVEYFLAPEKIHGFDIKLVMPGEENKLTAGERVLPLYMGVHTKKEIAVYRALLRVGIGTTISYGALARKAGLPGAARFAGSAMAKNSYPILIPCHRVVKSDGSLGNYGGGVHVKEHLLRHESAL
jgi:methylated-DNA-[protein]-cysteine S-methyltransferase